MFNEFQNKKKLNQYSYNTLEDNWYEDRCHSNYDKDKKKNYSLSSPSAWQYETSYNQIGILNKNYPSIQKKFANSNDNYINFQDKNYNQYISIYKNSYNSSYKKSLTYIKHHNGYYDKRENELNEYRNNWTKRDQSFQTTYKNDFDNSIQKK